MASLSFDQFLKQAGGKKDDVQLISTQQREDEARIAKEQADQAGSFGGLALETLKGIPKQLFDTLTHGTQETGKNIATAIVAPEVTKRLEEGDSGLKDAGLRVLKQIRANKEAGKDTALLEDAYNKLANESHQTQVSDILPALNKSNFEVVLDALTLGAEALGGSGIAQGGKAAVKAGARKGIELADDAVRAASEIKDNVRVVMATKGVNPQLEKSAERLFLEGTSKKIENPLASYEKFLAQSKNSLKDIKVDPAISQVGSKIGDAFEKVVAQRRVVGRKMGEELKKVGSIKTNIDDAFTGFETSLKDSDLVFNGMTKRLVPGKTSKMTTEDLSMLEDYIKEFNKLGVEPTIAEIDGFLGRTQSMVNNFKSAKGIVQTTNAERLIKGSQSALREQFDPAKTGNAALKKYADARKAYAQLSDFLDEGAGYLGKYTQSGDFVKDASIAKSAVQSILNNGKKDFLIKLESLTGYPAIDEAVLALQAMKDAGDFRGLSLLETMSDGAVPTSKAGFTQKIIDFAVDAGKRIVAGTPEEQTRAFLTELAKKANQGTIK